MWRLQINEFIHFPPKIRPNSVKIIWTMMLLNFCCKGLTFILVNRLQQEFWNKHFDLCFVVMNLVMMNNVQNYFDRDESKTKWLNYTNQPTQSHKRSSVVKLLKCLRMRLKHTCNTEDQIVWWDCSSRVGDHTWVVTGVEMRHTAQVESIIKNMNISFMTKIQTLTLQS